MKDIFAINPFPSPPPHIHSVMISVQSINNMVITCYHRGTANKGAIQKSLLSGGGYQDFANP